MAGDRIICHCKNVSYIDIRKAMIKGARTLEEVKEILNQLHQNFLIFFSP